MISVGTGGTISGVGRYFKERNPDVLIVGADPEGSIYTAEGDGDLHPYFVEGIGKDTWPETMDPKVVDEWVRVSDRDSFLTRASAGARGGPARRAARRARPCGRRSRSRHRLGPDAQILAMLPDSGRSYLSKFLDDKWMLEHGFLERTRAGADRGRAAAREGRRGGRRAGARHDLGAPEGRRGDRRDAALLDLAAPGRARRRASARSPT